MPATQGPCQNAPNCVSSKLPLRCCILGGGGGEAAPAAAAAAAHHPTPQQRQQEGWGGGGWIGENATPEGSGLITRRSPRSRRAGQHTGNLKNVFCMLPRIGSVFACCIALGLFSHVASHWVCFGRKFETYTHTPPMSHKCQTHFIPWRRSVDDGVCGRGYLGSKSVALQPVCVHHRGRVRMLRIAL